MITIKEIAEEAGVSTTTVSNVLHGKTKKVSKKTQEKIHKLLEGNNYIPRFGLNALTNRGSRMISVLVNTPVFVERSPYERPFYGNIIGDLERMLRKRGYYIMLFSAKDIQEIMKMTMGWNAEGIISISMPTKYYKQLGKMTGKPIVSIDMDEYDEKKIKGCYNITSKDFDGGYLMVDYLIQNKIEKIVYFTNTLQGADYRRYLGAKKCYQKHFGKNAELELQILGRAYEERSQIYESMRRLKGLDTALFFSTDLNAVEAISYFAGHGMKVPEDISVVGFDDDVYAKLSAPRLTTMKTDVTEKAECAVSMLMNLLEGEEVEECAQQIDVTLVERESVKKK